MAKLPRSKFFPSVERLDADGLVGFGGLLTPEWLLDAYSHGIFPWPTGQPEVPTPWFSPDPRAIIEFERFHVSQRLRRTCRGGRFAVTRDRAFAQVMQGCASAPDRRDGTWITPEMIAAYCQLHELGHAHSVEAWQGERLVGGVYGVSIGGLFAAESMFRLETDASKVALVHLVEHLQARGYVLLDIQQLTPHTKSLGAIEISRREYLERLARALTRPARFS